MLRDGSKGIPVPSLLITGGKAIDYGGGMYNESSSPAVTNCILWGDTAPDGSEFFDDNSTPVVSYSIVQGGYPSDTAIVTDDPLFVDAANGDFHLQAASPAIDAGNGCDSDAPLSDQESNLRWDIASVSSTNGYGAAVDIGAYEVQGTDGTDTVINDLSCP